MKIFKLMLLCFVSILLTWGITFAQPKATITLPTLSAAPGDRIDVPILVSTDRSIGVAQFLVDYNRDVLTFVEARLGTGVPASFSVSNINSALPFGAKAPGANENILVQISGGGTDAFTGTDIEAVIIQFDVIGAEEESSPLAFFEGVDTTFLSTDDLYDIVGSEITFINGSVTLDILTRLTTLTFGSGGWNMISAPLNPREPDPALVFGDDVDPLYFWGWDVVSSSYVHPDSVKLGKGYWLKVFAETATDVTGKKMQASEYTSHLIPGWQMIGEPFADNQIADVDVAEITYQGVTKSLNDAHAEGWVSKYLWEWYKDVNGDYYNQVTPGGTFHTLIMWKGYWIRAYVECELKLFASTPPQPDQSAAAIQHQYKGEASDWRIQLMASTKKSHDIINYIGFSNNASDAWDIYDVEEPPPSPESINLYFSKPGWAKHSGLYSCDIRGGTFDDSKTWIFEVANSAENTEVVLTWANIESIPDRFVIRLIDSKGTTYDMRTIQELRYISEKKSDVKQFTIQISSASTNVEEDVNSTIPKVSSLMPNYPNPFNPETTIFYEVGQEILGGMDVRLHIYNTTGQLVRSLIKKHQAPGRYSVTWDARDSNGHQVKTGLYFYRLTVGNQVFNNKMLFIK